MKLTYNRSEKRLPGGLFSDLFSILHCQKSNPNFRDITRNVEEILQYIHEIFRVVLRFFTFSPLHFMLYRGKWISFGTVQMLESLSDCLIIFLIFLCFFRLCGRFSLCLPFYIFLCMSFSLSCVRLSIVFLLSFYCRSIVFLLSFYCLLLSFYCLCRVSLYPVCLKVYF